MLGSGKQYNCAYIALGSNLENPIKQIQSAYEKIAQIPDTDLLHSSSFYKSAPEGQLNQPDYINAVVSINTALTPLKLLDALLKIELQHGRIRKYRNAPRTLDLDILLYGNLQLNDSKLIIPHPRMAQRAFVLFPLIEIAPRCIIPGHGKIDKLAAACSDQVIEQLNIS